MKDIYDYYLNELKLDCRVTQRECFSYMNASAGFYLLQDNVDKAIDLYFSVIKEYEKQKDEIETDLTQLIHTYYNLSLCLDNRADLDCCGGGNQEYKQKSLYYEQQYTSLGSKDWLNRYRYILQYQNNCEQVEKQCIDAYERYMNLSIVWYIWV